MKANLQEKNSNSALNFHFIEEKFIKSPLKKLMQTQFEMRIFKLLLHTQGLNLSGLRILEVGCGAGYGFESIMKEFHPKEYQGFDINPQMVALTKAKTRNYRGQIMVFLGDIRKVKLPSSRFDVVFAFTIFHHIIEWEKALKEVNRLLKPKGFFLVNEINNRSINRFQRYLKVYHPFQARFTWEMFQKGLKDSGFRLVQDFYFLEDLGFFLCIKI
ncbi:class I SAM-dependent methyltransferase [Candidatus Hodarchaeum mangrovi]